MNKLRALSTRYFLCHFLVGSANSFIDSLLKNGVIVYATFRSDLSINNIGLIAALGWSLFILPFFIFSAYGGYLGDRYDKRKISMVLRIIDIFLAAFAAFGFFSENISLLLVLIFAKGITSTLFSPLKYAMLSDFLTLSSLATGSSVLEAGTMIAMLGGTYAGAIYGADTNAIQIGAIGLTAAVMSFLATWCGSKSSAGNPNLLSPSFNPLKPTFEILHLACQDRRCMGAIVALSWYWSLGAVYMSNLAVLVRMTLLGDEKLVASILLMFTLGIGCGLIVGSYWLRGKPNARVSTVMSIVVGLAGINLNGSITNSLPKMLLDFFTIAFASGIYAVHFSAVLHLTVNQQSKARIFAAYNIMSSLFAVLALLLSTQIVSYGVSLPLCLSGFAVATIPMILLANWMIRRCSHHQALPVLHKHLSWR